MFKRFGNSSSTLWKSKNPHSVEYLRYLHGVLIKNEKVTESNKTLLIEAIRAIAEILIWGDQNDGSVFDFFLERQMLTHFLSIMKQRCGCYVNVQLLQTLNILFENIKHETSLYFLLSNNHVNSIILHEFDFNNEEVIAYYISFLKTLSFKLNTYTIHFFFNETNNEFPLFTQAVQFFNHSESMVRIAVRTLTLNVFKVKDEAMSKFVLKRCERYFNNVAQHIAEQVIEMDIFARSAQNEQSNRNRLLNMTDAHLDNMHYVNDILMIGNAELNSILMNGLFAYVIGPLYLASMAELRNGSTVLLSKVSSFFLMSHFVMVIVDDDALQLMFSSLLFGDENDIGSEWVRSVEKGLHLITRSRVDRPQERLFFNSHLKALKEVHDDHACFYALMLIYCIIQNKGLNLLGGYLQHWVIILCATAEMLEAAHIPCVDKSMKCDTHLMENLIGIIKYCSAQETSLRSITVELCCVVLRRMLLTFETDDFHNLIELAVSSSLETLTAGLRMAVFSENLFLEMFESEYYQLHCNELKMSVISENPGLYLPPSNTPLSGIPLSQRLPSGNDERIRRTLQFYFVLRKFKHDLTGESEHNLPLAQRIQPIAEVNDCINLNNSDLLSCTVITENGEKLSRFLVTDQFQLILVEPDNRKLGWAIVRFVGLLQDTQTTGDSSDSRAIHVVVEDVKNRTNTANNRSSYAKNASAKHPLLCAKFVFDDHIRCMAAKQRLSKGRKNARHFKINLICELFGMRPNFSGTSPSFSVMDSRNQQQHLFAKCQRNQSSPSPAILYADNAGSTSLTDGVATSASANTKNAANFPFRGPGFMQKLGAGAEHLRAMGAIERNATENTNGNNAEYERRPSSSSSQIPDDPDVKNSSTPPLTHSSSDSSKLLKIGPVIHHM